MIHRRRFRGRNEQPAVCQALASGAPLRGQEIRNSDGLFWRNARLVTQARVLLAFGNALTVYLDPALPVSSRWFVVASTYTTIASVIAYSFWVWRQETSPDPPGYLRSLATWLDVLFGTALIATTGMDKSPFYLWNVFTIVGSALNNSWRTAVRVCLAQTVLSIAICLPRFGHPDSALTTFVVETSYLFVIALVLAHMGQRIIEQNRMLAGLHRAATHMGAGRSTDEILGRLADSLTDLLEVERVAVARWDEGTERSGPVLVNLDREQGARLLGLARERLASSAQTSGPISLVSNAVVGDPRFDSAREALAGVRSLLITRLPGSRGAPGLLVTCNRQGERGFSAADQDMAELLAAQAGPLLETARLQEQRRYQTGADERRRIAAELHDRLIQTLAGMDLRIVTCAELWRQQCWEGLGRELPQLKGLAEEALEEARGAISELAPVRLREEGLAVYLQDCIRIFEERCAIPVQASIDLNDREVPEPTALLLIGLLREGLNNVRKHARARMVTLRIAQWGDEIQFRLTDDGQGFCPAACLLHQPPTRQYGLAYLRERTAGMGGELSVTSRPGQGTVLEARVPLLSEDRLVSLFARAQV